MDNLLLCPRNSSIATACEPLFGVNHISTWSVLSYTESVVSSVSHAQS